MTTQSATDPVKFEGREGSLYIADASDVDPSDETDNLKSIVTNATSSTEYSVRITELTLTDPEASVEVQNTFGGQIKTESEFELVTADFTMRFKDLEMMTELHGSTSSLTGTNAYTRKGGTDGHPGSKTEKSILFHLETTTSGTTYEINYLLHNAMFQQAGEISLEGDGTAEMTGTAVCLIKDRYIEKNF